MPSSIIRNRGRDAYRRAVYVVDKKPANTVLPAIIGITTVGQTLTCSTGAWTNTPDAYAYQWRRNGVAIDGATASTRLLVVGDAGAVMSCTVTATNEGISASATSAGTAAIAAA